jgi:hypothetical protein
VAIGFGGCHHGGTLWIIPSLGFTIYVANFNSYDTTYGSLGGVITWEPLHGQETDTITSNSLSGGRKQKNARAGRADVERCGAFRLHLKEGFSMTISLASPALLLNASSGSVAVSP